MRRQIGAVVPYNKLDRPMTGGWVAEYVVRGPLFAFRSRFSFFPRCFDPLRQRCVTGDDILKDWAAAVRRNAPKGSVSIKKMRAHILKIDVEGHDFDVSFALPSRLLSVGIILLISRVLQVLMSFLPDNVPNQELPLLINFEAKSIAEKFPLAKEIMEKRWASS